MNKRILFSGCIALLALSAGCTEDATENIATDGGVLGEGKHRIEVRMPEASRIGMGKELVDGVYPLHWQTGDQIIINGTAVSDPLNELFNGEKSAIFTTDITPEYPLTIVYPGTMLYEAGKVLIPTEQALLQEKLANGNGILIGHTVDAQDPLTVKHACAYLRVSLTGTAALKKVVLMATGSERLSGVFDYNFDTFSVTGVAPADKGSKTVLEKATDSKQDLSPTESASFIGITTDATLSASPLECIFALPAGTYTKGFTLWVVGADGNSMTKKMYGAEGITLTAGQLLDMPAIAYAGEQPHGIYTAEDWIAFATDTNHSAYSVDGKSVNVYADINLSAYERVPLASVDGGYTLNGNDHTISGIKATGTTKYSGLLFAYVDKGATIKNLTLGTTAGEEADSHLTVETTETSNSTVFAAPFCILTAGTIEKCVNNASLNLNVGGNGFNINAGGITTGNCNTSYTVGTLTKCENKGHITMGDGGAESYAALRIGGICGRAISATITDCVNSGPITLNINAAATYPQFGGIVGVSPAGTTSTITGCSNSAKLSIKTTVAHTQYVYQGGIAGAVAHNISNCHNTGEISATISKHAYVGGILGYCSEGGNHVLSSCTNRGHVVMGTSYAGYNFMGGICGFTTSESENTNPNKIENCTNYGFVEMQNKGRVRMGGISGSTCLMDGNTNYGTVQYSNTIGRRSSHIGGIVGTFGHTIANCNSYGDVIAAADGSGVCAGALGGLAVKRNSSFTGCKVDCKVQGFSGTVTDDQDYAYYSGMLFGGHLTRTITVGTEAAPCKVAGTLVLDGVEIHIASQEDITVANMSGSGTGTLNLTYTTYKATKPSEIK
ncbi:MAG: hypothetical protein IJ348_06110 [Alistipes sp.]|nr:hypothetical protein [Alistipes sp.]